MDNQRLKKRRRLRRKFQIRSKIHGHTTRPRLTVYRSLNHIYTQIIDDSKGTTLAAASTQDKELKEQLGKPMPKAERSKAVGQLIAKRALKLNIKEVTFDRNGYLYHGRVKALADAAREGGLVF